MRFYREIMTDNINSYIERLLFDHKYGLAYHTLRLYTRIIPSCSSYYAMGAYLLEYGKAYADLRGRFLYMRVSMKAARKWFKKAYRVEKSFHQALYGLGYSYERERNYEKSLLYYERLVSHDGQHPYYVWVLLKGYYLTNNWNRVLQKFELYKEVIHKDKEVWLWSRLTLAFALLQTQSMDKARKVLTEIDMIELREVENEEYAAYCYMIGLYSVQECERAKLVGAYYREELKNYLDVENVDEKQMGSQLSALKLFTPQGSIRRSMPLYCV